MRRAAQTKVLSILALGFLLAGCNGAQQYAKPSAPVVKAPALLLRITAPLSVVREDRPWPITVSAYTADPRAQLPAHISGIISYAFLLRGVVVSRQPGGQLVNGIFHGKVLWPTSDSVVPVVLRVSLTANGTTSTVDRSVYVTPSPQSLM